MAGNHEIVTIWVEGRRICGIQEADQSRGSVCHMTLSHNSSNNVSSRRRSRAIRPLQLCKVVLIGYIDRCSAIGP